MKLIGAPKGAYQKVELIGTRYVLSLDNGSVQYQQYGSANATPQKDKDICHIMQHVNNNQFLSKFSGHLEIVMNSFVFLIVDVMEDNHSNVAESVYRDRLQYLRDNIADDKLVISENTVTLINQSPYVPTLFRNTEYSYKYGQDYVSQPSKRDVNYVIVGEMEEVKEMRIYLPRKGYDMINKVPKVIKAANCTTLEEVNAFIQELYLKNDAVKVTKQGIEYVEIINADIVKLFLIAGKCPTSNQFKVFGKTKQTHKLASVDKTVSENVYFDWQNEKIKAENVAYFKNGYVISCLSPKVNSKTLAMINVMDVKQRIDLEKPIEVSLDEIPTILNQRMKKLAGSINTKILANELIVRLFQVPKFQDLAVQLQNVVDEDQVQDVRRFDSSGDSESDDEEDIPQHLSKKPKIE